MSDTVLDRAVLDMLRQLTPPGEPDVLKEVLTLFLSEFPPRLEKLRNAQAAGNIQEVQRAAHSMKGSAGNIGARALFDACKEIEEASKAGEVSRVNGQLDALAAEFGKVKNEIDRLMQADS